MQVNNLTLISITMFLIIFLFFAISPILKQRIFKVNKVVFKANKVSLLNIIYYLLVLFILSLIWFILVVTKTLILDLTNVKQPSFLENNPYFIPLIALVCVFPSLVYSIILYLTMKVNKGITKQEISNFEYKNFSIKEIEMSSITLGGSGRRYKTVTYTFESWLASVWFLAFLGKKMLIRQMIKKTLYFAAYGIENRPQLPSQTLEDYCVLYLYASIEITNKNIKKFKITINDLLLYCDKLI